jgi:hypothetical protein
MDYVLDERVAADRQAAVLLWRAADRHPVLVIRALRQMVLRRKPNFTTGQYRALLRQYEYRMLMTELCGVAEAHSFFVNGGDFLAVADQFAEAVRAAKLMERV